MTDKKFKSQMSRRERIGGIIYIPIHSILLPIIIAFGEVLLLHPRGITLSELTLNLIIYAIGFVFCLLFMWKFLKKSFGDIFDAPGRFIVTIFNSLCLNYLITAGISVLITVILADPESVINPNTEGVGELIFGNFKASAVMTVIFAPVIEECMFRGALFGSIRRKSRFWAYLITVVVFSVYHLWAFFVTDYSWELWIYLLQYVPATIILCRAYEKSETIWCPIAVHAVINLIATYAAKMIQ